MSEPYLAHITIVGFNFAPRGYALCDGQILSINTNQSLYSLLGTEYGGDGRTSFGLPDLRGRTPIHRGQAPSGGSTSWGLGDRGGAERVTLTAAQMPSHSHPVQATNARANRQRVAANPTATVRSLPAARARDTNYSRAGLSGSLDTGSAATAGSSSGHNNMMPFLTLNFCIATTGLFPSRN